MPKIVNIPSKKHEAIEANNSPALLPKITERQAKILAALVREYSNGAQPVGSEELNDKYRFNVSSATIRNEMMCLEKLGFIEQPHTSAGRIPTDAGYRYFINELMKRLEFSAKEQRQLQDQLHQLQKQYQDLGKSITKLLAQKTDQAAFALFPDENSSAGVSNILKSQAFDKAGMVEVVQFFENIDEYSDKMLIELLEEKSEAIIGKENNLPQISNYSLIVSKVILPDGKKGVIGILGPKSMRYEKNMTIVEYVAKLLSSGLLLVLLMNIKL